VDEHPIRLTVTDDLGRSRLTVFFRLLLAIPHLIALFLWTIAALFAGIVNWFATLFKGKSPKGLHDFLSSYLRYATHVYAYMFLATNPFPGFGGERSYPIDVEIDPPARQSRWTIALRIFLALPALLLAGVFIGGCGGGGAGGRGGGGGSDDQAGRAAAEFFFSSGGVGWTVAFLAWFACLARGRMPQGFRDLLAYVLRYAAQAWGYVFLLTDRYPSSDPRDPASPQPVPEHPIGLSVDDDLRRSRLTVFFRLLLTFPHFVWITLWWIAAFVAAVVNWIATLVLGRPPRPLHRFLSAFVRYETHVIAYLFLVANPFPGFVGKAGSYPVDPELPPDERQRRWVTAFRMLLAIPALIVAGAVGTAAFVAAFLGWFAALARGRMPEGLRNLGAYYLRYNAQVSGYALYLLTDRYPYSGPSEHVEPEPEEPGEAPPLAASA
jgi:hypothetical protein